MLRIFKTGFLNMFTKIVGMVLPGEIINQGNLFGVTSQTLYLLLDACLHLRNFRH